MNTPDIELEFLDGNTRVHEREFWMPVSSLFPSVGEQVLVGGRMWKVANRFFYYSERGEDAALRKITFYLTPGK